MTGKSISREERDALVRRIHELDQKIYPPDRAKWTSGRERDLLVEKQFQALVEYADRLPRMILSKCPLCDAPFRRVIDPYGLDGPWWLPDAICKFEEPAHCGHFRALLGALSLKGRTPSEVEEEIRPGPDAPFVVPALLDLPGMIAVIGRISIATGDTAYPIAYFSPEEINPALLHQTWCRSALWFEDDEGNQGWTVSNDLYDFDLVRYLRDGRLMWVDLDDPKIPIHPIGSEPCPFVDLPGDRERQIISRGERTLIGLPTGETVNPFEE